MLTRYKALAELYSDVLGNPNIITNITVNLSAKDVVNLILSNGDFTKNLNFQDVVYIFLTKEKEIYEVRVEKEIFQNTLHKFLKEMDSIIGINNRKRKVTNIFEFCLAKKEILFQEYDELKGCIYKKLLNFAIDDSHVFTHEALYYLDKFFDIHVQAQYLPGTENDYVEFIEGLDGKIIWL